MSQPRTVERHTPFTYKNDSKVRKSKKKLYGVSKKDSTLINTLVHETMHAQHPRMRERTVQKLTRKKLARMGSPAKKRMYNKLKSK